MKVYNKLTDAIEMIFDFLIDKNSIIKINWEWKFN